MTGLDTKQPIIPIRQDAPILSPKSTRVTFLVASASTLAQLLAAGAQGPLVLLPTTRRLTILPDTTGVYYRSDGTAAVANTAAPMGIAVGIVLEVGPDGLADWSFIASGGNVAGTIIQEA